jgi:hypothetical protein
MHADFAGADLRGYHGKAKSFLGCSAVPSYQCKSAALQFRVDPRELLHFIIAVRMWAQTATAHTDARGFCWRGFTLILQKARAFLGCLRAVPSYPCKSGALQFRVNPRELLLL